MISVILLVASALFVRAAHHDVDDLLARLDLKNYDEFQSEREQTSTDSTDSSSDAERIARAVEAALEAAELAPASAPAVAREFSTLRLRLGTTNKAFQCGFFTCDQLNDGSSSSDIEGAQATVTTSAGNTFTATFQADGTASHVRDNFFFEVTYENDMGVQSFELTTPATEFGVNVTSITISSPQGGAAGAAGMAFFTLPAETGFDEDTGLNEDETLQATLGTSVIGCDANFDGASETGSTSFTVSIVEGNTEERDFIVGNRTTDDTQSATFGGNIRLVADTSRVNDIGLGNLPCATRNRVIYDQTAIVTKRAGETTNTADTLLHPLLYDELTRTSNLATLSYEQFIFEMRVAAGRKQLRLRDIVLDTGAFSDLSHKSKFTPCFRVFPDDDYQIEVFIGMRGGTGEFVRALLSGQDLVQDGQVVFDPENPPQFTVNEVALVDLVGDQTDTTRPFELLTSDVSVDLEACPEFSYFA